MKGGKEMLLRKNEQIKKDDEKQKEIKRIEQIFEIENYAKFLLFTSETELQEKSSRSLINGVREEMKTLYVYPSKQNV